MRNTEITKELIITLLRLQKAIDAQHYVLDIFSCSALGVSLT